MNCKCHCHNKKGWGDSNHDGCIENCKHCHPMTTNHLSEEVNKREKCKNCGDIKPGEAIKVKEVNNDPECIACGRKILTQSINKLTPEQEKRFDEKFGDTDNYPNDLIPKNDVLATIHLIKTHLVTELARERDLLRGKVDQYLDEQMKVIVGVNEDGDLPPSLREDIKKAYYLVKNIKAGISSLISKVAESKEEK